MNDTRCTFDGPRDEVLVAYLYDDIEPRARETRVNQPFFRLRVRHRRQRTHLIFSAKFPLKNLET